MRAVPASILAELARQDAAIEPVVRVSIYHQTEGEDSLSTRARLEGDADVSRADDSNVVWDGGSSTMQLGPGAAYSLETVGTSALGAVGMNWDGWKRDVFTNNKVLKWEWTWFGPVPTYVPQYVHQGWDITSDPPRTVDFPFTQPASAKVDTVGLYASNGGNLPAVLSAVLLEASSGSQVGAVAQTEIAAGAATQLIALGGAMGASLFKGRDYILRLTVAPRADWVDALYAYKTEAVGHGTLRVGINGFTTAGASPAFSFDTKKQSGGGFLPSFPMGYIRFGGFYPYAASGSMTRNLDMTGLPSGNGVLSLSSIVPTGCALTISALYATNDAAVARQPVTTPANWTTISGPYADGMTLPPYRFFRVIFTLTSNPTHDETPQLAGFGIHFSGAPLELGSQAEMLVDTAGVPHVRAVRAVHAVSASSQALDAQLKTTMVGQFTVELAPEPEVVMLAAKPLRGKRVEVRAGIANNADSFVLYSGMVRDLSWSGGRYILTLQDPYELTDVSVPNRRHDDWSATTAYTGTGELVVAGDQAYRSILAGTNFPPASNPTYWAVYPSVLKPVVYPADTHLADIAEDILTNQINIPDRYLAPGSLDAFRQHYPARKTVAQVVLDRPIKARQLLDEIALLLDGQWMIRDGRIHLIPDARRAYWWVPEPDPFLGWFRVAWRRFVRPPDAMLTSHDIAEGLEWRAGQAEVKNGVLILSGWSASGGNEQWARGVVLEDAASVQRYGVATLRELKDRFGLPEAELNTIAQTHLTRWSNGRQMVRVRAWLSKVALEAGDIVELRSAQLPPHLNGHMMAQVVQSSLDWIAGTLTITLLEV